MVAAVELALGATSVPMATGSQAADKVPRLEVVLLNGGGRPAINYQSHLLHIKQFSDVLFRSGIPRTDIALFNADGADPATDFASRDRQPEGNFWLLQGTRLERPLRTKIRYENSEIDGLDIQPATRTALLHWFAQAARRLQPGDTLLFYVTDHGTKNAEDLSNNRITLWGKKESLSVSELHQLFDLFDPGVRVVVLMSQCYSGAFANLMYTSESQPAGNVCGFFSSTADRQAYGCYPENRDKDNVGHSFRFIENLAAAHPFPEAHNRVLVSDRTPDVPLKTSDVYLTERLEAAAQARGQTLEVLVDELLALAWQDQGTWEPEIRLIDRIAQAFGYFSPRSLAELREQAQFLPDISKRFQSYGKAWEATLNALATANLQRFLASQPGWQERVTKQALKTLDSAERRALTQALLTELAAFTRADPVTRERLRFLKDKSEKAAAALYRMQVRLGVVLRMQSILTRIAGQVYLTRDATSDEKQAYEGLNTCEALDLNTPTASVSPPAVAEPFPAYDEEIKLAEQVLPGWMGIRFKQANPTLRAQAGLQDGAAAVLAVYPDSPAQQAGFEVGDIVLGPPETPFHEAQQIREWIMTAPIGTPAPLQLLRDDQVLTVSLTPQRYPLKWPSLPGPPKVGSVAPPLRELQAYRGTLPVELAGVGQPYLLFFWATWCAPCKASLPEVVAFERERQIPVVAITDELPGKLDAFFKKHNGPFPTIVAVDEYRKAFLAYGVSGTPAYVVVDAAGKVQSHAVGYRVDRGLKIEGWSWAKPPPAAAEPAPPSPAEQNGSERPR